MLFAVWLFVGAQLIVGTLAQECTGELDHCDTCENAALMCTACPSGQVLRLDGTGCDQCPRACATCDYSSDGDIVCLQCSDFYDGRYIVSGESDSCLSCGSNCETCSPQGSTSTLCSKCTVGYYMKQTDATKTCNKCQHGCESCLDNGDGNPSCIKATDGFYIGDNSQDPAIECASHCERCTDSQSCLECESGHLLFEGECLECPSDCASCDMNDDNELECGQCMLGFGKKEHISCDKCADPDCDRCDNEGACELCADAHTLSTITHLCEPCPKNCLECYYEASTRKTMCNDNSCESNYAKNPAEGTCHACDENCQSDCVYIQYDELEDSRLYGYGGCGYRGAYCENCKYGYGYHGLYGKCIKCLEGSHACTWFANDYGFAYEFKDFLTRTAYLCGLDVVCPYSDTTIDTEVCDENVGLAKEQYIQSIYMDTDPPLRIYYPGLLRRKRDAAAVEESAPKGVARNVWNREQRKLQEDKEKAMKRRKTKRAVANDDENKAMEDTGRRGKRAIYEYYYSMMSREGDDEAYPHMIIDYCCQDGYGKNLENVAGFESCGPCDDPNCGTCDISPDSCEFCIRGYGRVDDGSLCTACSDALCLDCDEGSCNTCQDFIQYEDHLVEVISAYGACIACPKGCAYISGTDTCMPETGPASGPDAVGLCISNEYCIDGTGLIPDHTECRACSKGCQRCHYLFDEELNILSKCFQCYDGYALDEDSTCRACPSECGICNWDSGHQRVDCLDSGCKAGFAPDPDTGKCIGCGTGVMNCELDSEGHVTVDSCMVQYALNDVTEKCIACPDHCSLCHYDDGLNSIVCTDTEYCDHGFGLKADGKCYECPSNCINCYANINDQLECETCSVNFFANGGSCGECQDGCSSCSDVRGTMVCASCSDGYVWDSASRQCAKCPSNCEACEMQNGEPVCAVCSAGYQITTDGVCQACSDLSIPNCVTCTKPMGSVSSKCLSCHPGYALSDDNQQCLDCSQMDNCEICSDKGDSCIACAEGYYTHEDGSCAFDCLTCDNAEGDCTDIDPETASTEPCREGACWVISQESKSDTVVERGCRLYPCSGSTLDGMNCFDVAGPNGTSIEQCEQCCQGNKCNTFNLTGSASSLVKSHVMAAILLVICAILNN